MLAYSNTCRGWPLFRTKDELLANAPWAKYLSYIYPSLDGLTFPMCGGDLWMFYSRELELTGLDATIAAPSRCPHEDSQEGAHYHINSRLSPSNRTWSWHPHAQGFAPLANGTWVEVLHKGGIPDEHVGAWFLRARGSGVWLSVGRTLVFDDHDDAYAHFNLPDESGSVNATCKMGSCNEALCARAREAGYDTLQFVRHTCEMMYGDCLNLTSPTLRYFNHEVVHVRLVGIFPCASANGSSQLLQSGWPQAGRGAPCSCDNNASDHLHCAEVPASMPHGSPGEAEQPRTPAAMMGHGEMHGSMHGAMHGAMHDGPMGPAMYGADMHGDDDM